MSATVTVAMGTLAAGGAAAVGVGYAVLSHPRVREWRTPPGPPDAAMLRRYAESREYTRVRSQPAGSRAIPITGRVYTPLADNPQRKKVWWSKSLTIATLQAIKEGLRAAGRGDEDARCVWCLWAVESGHGRSVWNGNVGNIKCSPAATPELILNERSVWTGNPDVSGVYLLIDRISSFDSYFGFPDLGAYCRHQKRLFERPQYRGVLEGYRQGGTEGLAVAARGLTMGGYSGARTEIGAQRRIAEHLSVWRLYQRVATPQVWETLR